MSVFITKQHSLVPVNRSTAWHSHVSIVFYVLTCLRNREVIAARQAFMVQSLHLPSDDHIHLDSAEATLCRQGWRRQGPWRVPAEASMKVKCDLRSWGPVTDEPQEQSKLEHVASRCLTLPPKNAVLCMYSGLWCTFTSKLVWLN